MAPPSKYFRRGEDGVSRFVTDGGEAVMAGMNRMHFYRLTGATPEEASDEQVEKFFELRSQEDETGERVTNKLPTESATDMVTRELKILNLPQVMNPSDPLEEELNQPPLAAPMGEQSAITSQRQARTPLDRPAAPPSTSPLGAPPRYQAGGGGLPPAPRYSPTGESARPAEPPPTTVDAHAAPAQPAADGVPQSRYVRADGSVLWIQTPEGEEERVTQYMRTHFLRLIEKEIEHADDSDIELWWKSQGSLDAGTTMQEAQSQNMLAEALKAAGKLKLPELELLQQIVDSWLTARRSEGDNG